MFLRYSIWQRVRVRVSNPHPIALMSSYDKESLVEIQALNPVRNAGYLVVHKDRHTGHKATVPSSCRTLRCPIFAITLANLTMRGITMKSLSSYTQNRMTQIFEEHGVFFAFSKKQFEEGCKPGLKYVAGGGGMFIPEGKVNVVTEALNNIVAEGIQQDIAENGIENIIRRELNNYECLYTGRYKDAAAALVDYGITEDQVLAVFDRMYDEQEI